MNSWWDRNYDQGAFTNSAAVGTSELTARLIAIGPDHGSPGSSAARRTPRRTEHQADELEFGTEPAGK